MDVERLEIRDFLVGLQAFATLPDGALATLTNALSIVYLRRGTPLAERSPPMLDVVRSGALEVRASRSSVCPSDPVGRGRNADGPAGNRSTGNDTDGDDSRATLVRLGEGDTLVERVHRPSRAAPGTETSPSIEAIEDTLLYRVPLTVVEGLVAAHPSLAGLLVAPGGARLRESGTPPPDTRTMSASGGTFDLLTTALGDIVSRAPVWLPPSATIRETAERMNRERVTAMLLVEGERATGRLVGIVTDRDLRLRVIVEGVDTARPVADIMSGEPVTAEPATLAHDALLLMARHGIHHLPVVDGARALGLVTASDFVERRSSSSVRLAAALQRAADVDTLARESRRSDALYAGLVASGATTERIGRVTSGVADALTRRLLELAGERVGGLPDGLTWLVTGSQARREWHAGSIRANASLLDDAARDDARVAELARHVHDGLARCGLPVPPEETLPSLPGVHLDARGWHVRVLARLDGGGDTPGAARGPSGGIDPRAETPLAALLDLRAVHGDEAAVERLRTDLVAAVRTAPSRLARLVAPAFTRSLPCGFFRDTVLDEDGTYAPTFDLSNDGVRRIVDIARACAVAGGEDPLGTRERLVAAADSGELGRSLARDLDDALDLVSGIRARHLARQVGGGRAPDEHVAPSALTRFERDRLTDVLAVVREAGRVIARRHGG